MKWIPPLKTQTVDYNIYTSHVTSSECSTGTVLLDSFRDDYRYRFGPYFIFKSLDRINALNYNSTYRKLCHLAKHRLFKIVTAKRQAWIPLKLYCTEDFQIVFHGFLYFFGFGYIYGVDSSYWWCISMYALCNTWFT